MYVWVNVTKVVKCSLFVDSELIDHMANSRTNHMEMELRACWNFKFLLARSITAVFKLVELIVAIV